MVREYCRKPRMYVEFSGIHTDYLYSVMKRKEELFKIEAIETQESKAQTAGSAFTSILPDCPAPERRTDKPGKPLRKGWSA